MSVLLVDDDMHTRHMFEMVSEHHQFNLTAVETAESAFEYLENNSPDVIVMDIFLPGMDGYKAFMRMRDEGLKTGVVATTAYYNSDTEAEVRERGFAGYLPKPFNPQTLATYLQSLIKK
jgi:CheY-like chemotaxis protein